MEFILHKHKYIILTYQNCSIVINAYNVVVKYNKLKFKSNLNIF